MILKIILLIILFIVLALLLFFLSCILVPAVKKQTKIHDNMIFSKIEHKFKKLETKEEAVEQKSQKALVMCSCNKTFEKDRQLKIYKGSSCKVINDLYSSNSYCKFACIGQGDCKNVCPQDAIILKNNTALVTELCTGCGLCVDACPKSIIKMVPVELKKTVICSNTDMSFIICSNQQKEENIVEAEKKYFKIWKYCYKILGNNKKN